MKKFPEGFVWGTATSSYQIEGGWNAGGKGASIWDDFTHTPEKIKDGSTGDISCDHYHRFREDVRLMAELGLKHYRFSISWPRVLPGGEGAVNEEGLRFYSELVDELLRHDIQPWVTLYHWDLPLALQRKYDGWLSPKMPELFADYARVCFKHLGDRVKNWITLNEPWVVASLGYGDGVFAPGVISNDKPYLVGHQLLLAHGRAVEVYRREFQQAQGGRIGISNNCDWRAPLNNREADRQAAQRALEFFLGWFADPIFLGDYPEVMKRRVKDRLPVFSEEERRLLLGSSDFFGLNHYTTMYAAESFGTTKKLEVYGNGGISEDQDVALHMDKSAERTDIGWAVTPWGLQKLLCWIDERYGKPEIIITENGCAYEEEVEEGQDQALRNKRIEFYRSYLEEAHRAIERGVNLRGYFAWSFMDNFEWIFGYTMRFGLVHVDQQTRVRTPKPSAFWYGEVVKKNAIGEPGKPSAR